jgi:hypothetical protein
VRSARLEPHDQKPNNDDKGNERYSEQGAIACDFSLGYRIGLTQGVL